MLLLFIHYPFITSTSTALKYIHLNEYDVPKIIHPIGGILKLIIFKTWKITAKMNDCTVFFI